VSALHPAPTSPGTFLCPRCGSRLREDQSWCIECGFAARTRVHPPPNWRAPVILTCVLLALVAAGIAIGLAALLDNGSQTAPTATTVTVPAATAPATTPTAPETTAPETTVPTTSVPQATVPTTPAPAPSAKTVPTVPAAPKTLTIPRGKVPATGGAGTGAVK